MKRPATKAEKLHLSKVAALGCICCAIDGRGWRPANIHHIREGYGMGQRAPHMETLPLCEGHHQGLRDCSKVAFHKSPIVWREWYGEERQLVAAVNATIAKLDAANPGWWIERAQEIA